MLDGLFYLLGQKKTRRDMALKSMLRRMAAVSSADESGDWSITERAEGAEASDFLCHQKRQQYFRQLKTKKVLADKGDKKSTVPEEKE